MLNLTRLEKFDCTRTKLFKEKLLLAGEIGGDPKKDADASITRKYRLMFNKYGFAYPEVLKKDGFSQKR